jgi:hypothetical protein
MGIMELSRGNSEIVMRSKRLSEAWARKKREAAERGKPLSKLAPVWLRSAGGKFGVNEEAAETVRLMYRSTSSPGC